MVGHGRLATHHGNAPAADFSSTPGTVVMHRASNQEHHLQVSEIAPRLGLPAA
jgi:hypothetical protein